jgi:hypothetical protein
LLFVHLGQGNIAAALPGRIQNVLQNLQIERQFEMRRRRMEERRQREEE